MHNERRKSLRIPGQTIASLHTVDSVVSKEGIITDLSTDGVGFESEAVFEKNEDIFLNFNMPIEVQAEVVRVKKNGSRKKYGAKFGKLSDAVKRQIDKYLTTEFD